MAAKRLESLAELQGAEGGGEQDEGRAEPAGDASVGSQAKAGVGGAAADG